MSVGQKIRKSIKFLGQKIQDNKGKFILGLGAAGIAGLLATGSPMYSSENYWQHPTLEPNLDGSYTIESQPRQPYTSPPGYN